MVSASSLRHSPISETLRCFGKYTDFQYSRLERVQMTDHRVTEITYGHLGEASYDLEEQSWTFSRHTTLGKSFSLFFISERLSHLHRVFYPASASSKRMYSSIVLKPPEPVYEASTYTVRARQVACECSAGDRSCQCHTFVFKGK